jgi:hypothetical protein
MRDKVHKKDIKIEEDEQTFKRECAEQTEYENHFK